MTAKSLSIPVVFQAAANKKGNLHNERYRCLPLEMSVKQLAIFSNTFNREVVR
jgi:hypothetical protein